MTKQFLSEIRGLYLVEKITPELRQRVVEFLQKLAGVSRPEASKLKREYLLLVRDVHPDKQLDDQELANNIAQLLNAAWDVASSGRLPVGWDWDRVIASVSGKTNTKRARGSREDEFSKYQRPGGNRWTGRSSGGTSSGTKNERTVPFDVSSLSFKEFKLNIVPPGGIKPAGGISGSNQWLYFGSIIVKDQNSAELAVPMVQIYVGENRELNAPKATTVLNMIPFQGSGFNPQGKYGPGLWAVKGLNPDSLQEFTEKMNRNISPETYRFLGMELNKKLRGPGSKELLNTYHMEYDMPSQSRQEEMIEQQFAEGLGFPARSRMQGGIFDGWKRR